MLERQRLLLCPWAEPTAAPAAPRAGPRRQVLDAATGEPLGFVARRRPASWLRWLAAPVLEVYETEDASLLCTLRGPFWKDRPWEVHDADERHVGSFDRSAVRDAYGVRLAALHRQEGGPGTAFVTPAGLELAAFAPGERGVLLAFAPAVDGNPFARMALLGAALVLV